MPPFVTVECARSEELTTALRLVFRHSPADEREARVGNALHLVRRGELDTKGILVLRELGAIRGALICLPVPGASALFWPPQVRAGRDQQQHEDRLIHFAIDWLQRQGAKLGQSLLRPEEAILATPLERNGFQHITSLWYLRHALNLTTEILLAAERLTYESYAMGDRQLFQRTLMRTYEGTLDCPEVNGVRSVEEIIEGHQAQGVHDPAIWWLALDQGQPAGVLLLTDTPDCNAWDVSYVGVVPEARRRGHGREMMVKALREAARAETSQLTLSIDTRNQLAWELYRQLHFEPFDQREVYLAIWR